METQERLQRLQKHAKYRTPQAMLRRDAIGSLVFGVVAIILGLRGLEVTSLNAILVLIGLFLLAAGIWGLAAPGRTALLLAGTGFILVGVWNSGMTALELMAGVLEPNVAIGVVGLIQIGWGIKILRRNREWPQ